MGKVPSPTNLFGFFETVFAKSSFKKRERSKVSSGLAFEIKKNYFSIFRVNIVRKPFEVRNNLNNFVGKVILRLWFCFKNK
jgi:hypothetical protein